MARWPNEMTPIARDSGIQTQMLTLKPVYTCPKSSRNKKMLDVYTDVVL